MASRLLDRLKRSLFKEGQGAEPQQEQQDLDRWEAELEEEEESVAERLGGTLCFDGGLDDGAEGGDSDSDTPGEPMEEGLSSTDSSPVAPPSSLLARQLQDSWRSLRGAGGSGGLVPAGRRPPDSLLFEVTDASVVTDGSSKYVLYTIHVIQSGGSDKTPAVISRRYSDFQKLHAALRRHHGDQMERVSFPRKKLRRNFTSETIGRRSRAFEQYLSHLCSLLSLRGAPCLRDFFYLRDLQAGQQLIRAGRFQEALAPLLNAKRLQHRLGGAGCPGSRAGPAPPASSHWLFTLAGLCCCFREANQLEEARDHCDQALRLLAPAEAPPPRTDPAPTDRPRPNPLLLPLLQAVVRLCWQTGRAKRQWEELLQQLVEQQGGLDLRPPSLTEALLSHDLLEADGEATSA